MYQHFNQAIILYLILIVTDWVTVTISQWIAYLYYVIILTFQIILHVYYKICYIFKPIFWKKTYTNGILVQISILSSLQVKNCKKLEDAIHIILMVL